MKRSLITTFLLMFATLSFAQKVSRIHVEDNHFVNAEGKKIILQGLCFSDPVKLVNDKHWDEKHFETAAEWGVNVVRFAVHPQNINRLGWQRTFEEMDKGIEWAKERGLYVIMDWHSIGNLKDQKFYKKMYRTDLQETLRFWKTVAQRYKDESVVALYELYNEPTTTAEMDLGSCTWKEWKSIQEQIIDTIRAYNPDAVCLCAGFNWAYDLTSVATDPINRPNIAYVAHPYPMKREQPWEENWEKDFGYVADKYPVVCTEIGYCLADEKGAHVPVKSTDVYGEHITRYFEKKGISFTVWCFDPDWPPMLITDWNYTPSTQGRFFKGYFQENKSRCVTDIDTLTANHPEYQSGFPVGSVVPEIEAKDTLGNTIRLSDYRGKYVVLDFWATWCKDCRHEIPFLKEVYADYKNVTINGKPLEWLSLSFDTNAESWKRILRKEKFPWTQISKLKSTREDSTFKDYKLNWIPSFIIIDPEGRFISSAITADGLRKNIEALSKDCQP